MSYPKKEKYFDARELDPEKVYTFGKPIEEMKLTAAQACAALGLLLKKSGFVPVRITTAPKGAAFTLIFSNPADPLFDMCYSFITRRDHTFDDVENAFAIIIRLLSQKGARRFMEVKRDEK